MTRPPHPIREAHAHLPWHARALSMLNLEGCEGVGECLERLRSAQGALLPGQWLLATGARVESWRERRWPTLSELDAVGGDRPLAMMSFDHHALAANGAALTAARVLDGPPSDKDIERDDAGSPTGLVRERAAYAVWESAPQPTPAQWRSLIPMAIADLSRHGFVEVHDMYAPDWLGPLLRELDETGELTLSVRLFAPFHALKAEMERAERYRTALVEFAGAKLFADGTLNSRTAWMLSPFANPIDGLPTGKVVTTQAAMRDAMEHTARLGVELAIHAIGDGAVRACLDAAEQAHLSTRLPMSHVRIEHCELIDSADVPRFAPLGVTASVQPCHLLADIEALRSHLPHRLDRVLPLRALIDSGLEPGRTLIFGSDVPVVRPDPQDSIQAAVYRRRTDMPPSEAVAPDQAITPDEAWACFRAAAPSENA